MAKGIYGRLDPDAVDFDKRRTGTRSRPGMKKGEGAERAWRVQFPDKPLPHWRGSIFYVYQELEANGWKWSSKYGWQKNGMPAQ